jgi:hypothetical protein
MFTKTTNIRHKFVDLENLHVVRGCQPLMWGLLYPHVQRKVLSLILFLLLVFCHPLHFRGDFDPHTTIPFLHQRHHSVLQVKCTEAFADLVILEILVNPRFRPQRVLIRHGAHFFLLLQLLDFDALFSENVVHLNPRVTLVNAVATVLLAILDYVGLRVTR